MAGKQPQIVDGIEEHCIDDALGILYDAFAVKFRHGFRNANDLRRLFRRSVDASSCYSAALNGRLLGILTIHTTEQDFYRLSVRTLFTSFSPIRALRIVFNLFLLIDRVETDEFIVESIAVHPDSRGLGVGARLMKRAEQQARAEGKRLLSLNVIGDNEGAIRLYERLGYRITKTMRGYLVRLASGSEFVHRMEKPLDSGRSH